MRRIRNLGPFKWPEGSRQKPPPTYATGQTVGRLTLLAHAEGVGCIVWRCVCDCGAECVRSDMQLAAGMHWCGTHHPNASADHAVRSSAEHGIWRGMVARCANANDPLYGGRGIGVCERWASSFQNFLADMGRRPSDEHSLDRIDVNGDYEPGNCRWATSTEQNRNRRNNVLLTLHGRTQCMAAWAEEIGLTLSGLKARLGKMTIEEALTRPPGRWAA